jgi:hypothetical protein
MGSVKIGIGLLTYKRPECKQLFLDQLKKYPPFYNYTLHIEEDNPSISRGKNNCLHALRDCDSIVLFDDDCFPIKEHWDLPLIDSGQHHLLFMDHRHGEISDDGEVTKYTDCSGCFLFLTKEVFEKVGYFNTAYPFNGLEHVAYSTRIKKATREDGFYCLSDMKKYFYSLDLQQEKTWNVWHKTTISNKKKTMALTHNRLIFTEEINSEKIYYEKA